MSSCCKSTTQTGRTVCPACGQHCLPVSRQTMLHQIQAPQNQQIHAADYAFCANRRCSTGYVSANEVIPKSELRAFQPGQPAMLCHCFDISEASYRTALSDGTAAAIKAFVIQQTKEKLCACESRNPSGRCCLAGFKQMAKVHDD